MEENIDDNLAMVQVILLWRIYDAMMMQLAATDPGAAVHLAKLHTVGQFATPNPSYSAPED